MADAALLNMPRGRREYFHHVGGPWAVHPVLQAGLIAGGRRENDGRLSSSQRWTPVGNEPRRGVSRSKPREVQHNSKWKTNSGRHLLDEFEKKHKIMD